MSDTQAGVSDPGLALTEMIRLSETLIKRIKDHSSDALGPGITALVSEWNSDHHRYSHEQNLHLRWGGLLFDYGWSPVEKRREVLGLQLSQIFSEAGCRIPSSPIWRPRFFQRWDEVRCRVHEIVERIREEELNALGVAGVLREYRTPKEIEQVLGGFVAVCDEVARHCPAGCCQVKLLTEGEWGQLVVDAQASWNLLFHRMGIARGKLERLRTIYRSLSSASTEIPESPSEAAEQPKSLEHHGTEVAKQPQGPIPPQALTNSSTLPTLYYHDERSYSTGPDKHVVVSETEHKMLQKFLKAQRAIGTRELECLAGNVSATIAGLAKKFGWAPDGPIGKPVSKGAGYLIRVIKVVAS